MPAFEVNHPRRLPPAKVLGSAPTTMLYYAPFDIVTDPRVQRIIVTADHVDVPVHGNNRSAEIVVRTTPTSLTSIRFKTYRRTPFVSHAPLPFAPFKALNCRGSDAGRRGCASVGAKLAPDDQHQQRYSDENQ
jgi:hypothetical protein